MNIWGISDLHLTFSTNKPMDVFGGNWVNYVEKMEKNWDQLVKDEDLVLCPGDLSWALKLEEAQKDLLWFYLMEGQNFQLKIM